MLKETIFSEKVLTITTHLLLIVVGVSMVIPFLWMLSTSLKDVTELYKYPPKWIPAHFNWQNYVEALKLAPFGTFYINSIFVTVCITLGQLVTACLAAYVFARIEFPGRNTLFVIYLSTMIVPIQVTIIPLFLIVKNFGWVDTYMALIIPQMLGAFGGMFSIFLLTQSFKAIPKELEEAAIIDGAGRFRIFWQIMLPQVKPAFAALLIFTFNSAWNDFLIPLIVTNSDKMKVLSLGIMGFTSLEEAVTPWNLMMAASLMTLLPIIIIFIVAQKHFIASAAGSGLKG